MTSSMNPEIPVSKTVSLPCEKNTRLRLAELLISVRDQEELLEDLRYNQDLEHQ